MSKLVIFEGEVIDKEDTAGLCTVRELAYVMEQVNHYHSEIVFRKEDKLYSLEVKLKIIKDGE